MNFVKLLTIEKINENFRWNRNSTSFSFEFESISLEKRKCIFWVSHHDWKMSKVERSIEEKLEMKRWKCNIPMGIESFVGREEFLIRLVFDENSTIRWSIDASGNFQRLNTLNSSDVGIWRSANHIEIFDDFLRIRCERWFQRDFHTTWDNIPNRIPSHRLTIDDIGELKRSIVNEFWTRLEEYLRPTNIEMCSMTNVFYKLLHFFSPFQWSTESILTITKDTPMLFHELFVTPQPSSSINEDSLRILLTNGESTILKSIHDLTTINIRKVFHFDQRRWTSTENRLVNIRFLRRFHDEIEIEIRSEMKHFPNRFRHEIFDTNRRELRFHHRKSKQWLEATIFFSIDQSKYSNEFHSLNNSNHRLILSLDQRRKFSVEKSKNETRIRFSFRTKDNGSLRWWNATRRNVQQD